MFILFKEYMILNIKFKHFVLLMVVLFSLQTVAQTRQQMRDSLALAVRELSFKPDSIDLRLKKAAWNVQLEQWQYAHDEYDYVLQREPANVAALFYRAFVNEKQKRYKFARLDYENLLAIVPGHFEASLGLSLLNQKDSRYTEAFDQINLLVAQHPKKAVAWAARAGIEMERKMYEPAKYDYNRAVQIDPDNVDYRLCLVNVLLILRQKKEALEQLDQMVEKGTSRASLVEWYSRCK